MTLAPLRPPSSLTWPGLHVVPTGPWALVSARIARRLFTAAVNRLPVTVHLAGVRRPAGPRRPRDDRQHGPTSSSPASAATA